MKRFLYLFTALVIGLGFGWFTLPVGDDGPRTEMAAPSRDADPHGGTITRQPHGEISRLFANTLDSPSDCQAELDALKVLRGQEHPLLLAALRDRALRRWVELDAESALAFAEQEVRGEYEPGVAADLFRVWLDLDVDSALESFAQASPSLVMATRRDFFSDFARLDPRRAAEELAKPRWEGLRGGHQGPAYGVFTLWASEDPRAAAEAARKWPHGGGYDFSESIARIWAEKDPAAAWDFYGKENPDDPGDRWQRSQLSQLLAGYLLEQDPHADLGEFSEHEKQELARNWADRNPESAIAFALSRPDDDVLARSLLAQASRQLATPEPERALELFLQRDGSSREYENRETLRQAFASLAASGVDAGMERWTTLPEAYKSDALSGVLTFQFAADPLAAVARWREWFGDPAIRPSLLPAMAVALSWGHGGGAQDVGVVVQAIPEFGEHVREYVLQGWVKTDPEEAADFIAERVRASGGADIGDQEAIAELTFSRPEFTAQWLPGLPEGAFRNDAAAALAANWSRFNPAAAALWVAGLRDGAMKASAARALAGSE